MAAKLRQDSRIGSFNTPLGKDELALYRFEGSEGLSELFDYRIEALSETEGINFDPAIGANCCVSIKTYDGSERYFNGTLVETQWLGIKDTYHAYRLVLRPWLWMLSCVSDCKMFSDKDIPTIIKEIFGKHGFAKYEFRLQGSYPTLEYCVQYRETDLNFVCRLMEEAGIYYFFEHSEDEHKMVLADSPSSHKPKQGGAKLVYRRVERSPRRKEEILYDWFAGRRFNTGKVVLNDYDYLKPSASLVSEKEGGGSYQNASLEVYDYPGRFTDKGVGQNYAKVRLESGQSTDHRCLAVGDSVSCCPGTTIALEDHPDGAQNRDYLIVKAVHSFMSDLYRSAAAAPDELYEGRYEYLPNDIQFRCPQVTPKPRIHGLQTAKVAGQGEIDVDKYGRIILHFFWDRDKKDSRRVRIAQIWSDKNWGGIVIPRVGQEVVVQYTEGDPDQPLVVGTVYNADKMPPYDLPWEKTIAGVKSNSSEGGGGYNEFVFDDKTGSELIRMHGQKDLEGKIENDERWKIGHDRTENIGNVMTVVAGTKIELRVATSKVVIEPQGITIQAPMITIKADALINESAPITQVTGTGFLILQGGLVKIN
jgi:type VI secretion system secreted protein VgrG